MYFSGIKIYLLLWDEVLLIDTENELDFQKFEKKVTHNSKKPNDAYIPIKRLFLILSNPLVLGIILQLLIPSFEILNKK